MRAASIALFAGLVACAFVQLTEADAVTYKEKVLHSFCSQPNCADGAEPVAGLIDVNGVLYGTTYSGGGTGCGGAGCGTVFSIDPNTGAETVLHAFQGGTDGANPYADVITVNGVLYGTTLEGGTENMYCGSVGCGTVFSLDPDTGIETVLYSFCSQPQCGDGSGPLAGLIAVNGLLYGTTSGGGNDGVGTVFALDPTTDSETVVYSFCSQNSRNQPPPGFNCTDGYEPLSNLIDVKGVLYGTTVAGGNGWGTVYSVNPSTGAEKVVYSFLGGGDGALPFAGLVEVKGTLYGTTEERGYNPDCGGVGCGTVFSISPDTGGLSTLYRFLGGTDGAGPEADMIDVKGVLYGTTIAGGIADCGNSGCGTVFSIDPSTAAETVLYAFCSRKNCKDGANPFARVVAVNGKLYGTTEYGGLSVCTDSAHGCGTVYVLKKEL